jgi:hypothetical protein
MAELDAAFFVLYGIRRADAEYILGNFAGLRSEESTTARILAAYERFAGCQNSERGQ